MRHVLDKAGNVIGYVGSRRDVLGKIPFYGPHKNLLGGTDSTAESRQRVKDIHAGRDRRGRDAARKANQPKQ